MQLETIAHRGFSAIAPENTLTAFAAAIANQANSIEFDVQLSRDRVPVIIHDSTLERTTTGSGEVKEQTLEQLKLLDAGSWFDAKFCGESIPSLSEALNAIKGLDKFVYPEVKNSEYWTDVDVDSFVQILIESGWENRCVVACFNEKFLERVRERSRQLILGFLVPSASAFNEKLTKATADGNAMMLSQYHALLANPSLVKTSRERGVDVGTWTVDSQADLQKLTDIGVVRIITNSLIK